MKRRFFCFVLVMVLLMVVNFVSSCNESNEPTTTTPVGTPSTTPLTTTEPVIDKHGETLKYLAMMAPGSPIGWPPDSRTSDTIPCLEGLVVQDNQGNLIPWLATEWKLAEDKLSMTIKLRQGVKFHDGTDFDVEAAKFAMDAWIDGSMAPQWKSVDIIDENTIKLNFNYWENGIYGTLGARIFISPTAYETKGLDWVKWNPVGTGAFKFVSFTRDTSMIFTRNNDWWNKGPDNLPYMDGIEFIYFADKTAEYNAFLAGSGHCARMLSVQQSQDIMNRDGYTGVTGLDQGGSSGGGVVYLAGDTVHTDSPFAKQKVREAIEYAIDKNGICTARGFGFWSPANQLAAYGSEDVVSDVIDRSYDPAKAKALLEEAGYPDGFKTKIIPDPAFIDPDAVTAVQGFLKAVNIDASIEMVDMGKFMDLSQNGWDGALLMVSTMFNPNFASSMMGGYYTGRIGMVSVDLPDEWITMMKDALDTAEVDHAKERALITYLNETNMVIPIYAHHEPEVIVEEFHDGGFFSLAGVLDWTPWYAWLSQK